MTPIYQVYNAFLSKMLDDEWTGWEAEDIERDWRSILDSALPYFRFPRKSLEIEEHNFVDDLDHEEIQILATLMKCEWLNRTILTWEHVKPMYEEKDFSEANLIDKFREKLKDEREVAHWQESNYYRSRDGKPFDFSKMAGGVQ